MFVVVIDKMGDGYCEMESVYSEMKFMCMVGIWVFSDTVITIINCE